MSIRAMVWVLDHSEAEGPDRLVLLALANHYNDRTGRCNPGQRRLARQARVSQSTANRAVRRLIDAGDVALLERGTGRRSTLYTLPRVAVDNPASDSPRPNANGLVDNPPSDSLGRIATETRSDSREARSDSREARSDSPRRNEITNAEPLRRTARAGASPQGGAGAQPPTATTDASGATFLPGTGRVATVDPPTARCSCGAPRLADDRACPWCGAPYPPTEGTRPCSDDSQPSP